MTVTPRGGGQPGSQTVERGPDSQDDDSSEASTSHEKEQGTTNAPKIEELEDPLSNLTLDDDSKSHVKDEDFDENGDPIFPHAKLANLDEMVNRPKWVIPVLPDGELEVLLEASIELAKKGLDVKSVACQKFIKDGLTISFNKIFLDDAVNTWKFDIHKCILKNAEKLIELCVVKLEQDWFPLLDLMSIALNPTSRFHLYNIARPSETCVSVPGEETSWFARPPDQHQPKGWLVDLVNRFGDLHGFDKLKKRICDDGNLTVQLICAHIKPFGLCAEVLTGKTIRDYMMPIVLVVKTFLEGLTDEMLKKESKYESKNEAISTVFKSLKHLSSRIPDQEELCRDLEKLRLQIILRLLQVSSFNGKMNALNEINRVISNVSYYSHHRHSGVEDDEFLTMEMVAKWLQENSVLSVVLKDNLHQPQYVEKLEKIIRFAIKVRALTLEDLDTIWDAQIGKHEAIVKNVHDLLAKLAWDFSAEQLDHLFLRFQNSWNGANKKQREKLLELIRRLAEDDKEGVIAHKVLGLLWQLAHSDDLPTDIMDQALVAHIKILDYSCSQTQDRDNLKLKWISRCVDELREGKWVIPALKQIKAICELFYEGYSQMANPHVLFRNNVIEEMQSKNGVVNIVAENLSNYMIKIRDMYKANPSIDPFKLSVDNRYSHVQQIHERLSFLRFVLNDGKMWLCEPQAKQIWVCLAVNCVFSCDRDVCFQWFSEVMGDDPDLDPEICKQFFEENVLTTDPAILNEHGIICFERFFKFVNAKEGLLQKKRNGTYVLENMGLIGLSYLWNVILNASDVIAHKAIEIFKEIFTNLGPHMRQKQSDIHNYLINSCLERLRPSYQTLLAHKDDSGSSTWVKDAARKIVLCLKTLKEYTAESDNLYTDERMFLPHERACRGRQITLYVRFQPQSRQTDEFEVWSHANESLAAIRRYIHSRLKMSQPTVKLDLYCNGELLNPQDDKRLVGQVPLKDRTILTVKLGAVEGSSPSSPDSSSDSSPPMTPQPGDGPNLEAEENLPGVIMSRRNFVSNLFNLGDQGISCQIPELRDICLSLLKLIPSDRDTIAKIRHLCQERALKGVTSSELDSLFFIPSPMRVLYHLEVIYSLLMPALQRGGDIASAFQRDFILAGGIHSVINMLTKSNFMESGDSLLKRSSYQVLFKISKFIFTVIGHAQVAVVAEAIQKDSGKELPITAGQRSAAVVLQQALQHLPSPYFECILRDNAGKLGQTLGSQAIACTPDLNVVKQIQKIVWAAAGGNISLLQAQSNNIHGGFEEEPSKQADFDDICLAKEALESLTLSIALCPSTMECLLKDKTWQAFIINLVLACKSRAIRVAAAEQFYLIATKCCNGEKPLMFFIQLLLTVRTTKVVECAGASNEYFGLLCRLLNFGRMNETNIANSSVILDQEIAWLRDIQSKAVIAPDGADVVDVGLLEGHLSVIRELLFYQPLQKKYQVGSERGGVNLVKNLMDNFIFSASRLVLDARNGGNIFSRHVNAICNTPSTMVAGLDLLVALCTGCVHNLRLLAEVLTEMYYSGAEPPLTDWEFQPPVGPRPTKGFVGLKNAGATCYMNSVLQQLYMIPEVRSGILEVDELANCEDERLCIDDRTSLEIPYSQGPEVEKQEKDGKEAEKQYHIRVLRQVQGIFGHLSESKLQFHVPEGFWKSFRLWGEPVNLREQHDALEFFNTLVDNLDEGLKVLGRKTVLSKVLGGSFADQKICKECPHRYSRETPFTSLNVDVRNHHNLIDSLEQYVKGDLLEGANAYYCEKCDKKVDTVKRMCIKKLPKVLAIQLKRFDYDWERDCAVKFNDYFEFPREFNMEPFTVEGLARIEGQTIEDESCTDRTNEKDRNDDDEYKKPASSVYKLVGVVVHSGQASGGHYYSYIIPRPSVDSSAKWYKFDDGEVSECSMDDDEDIKNQCFGGEYTGEVFDHMLKRMSYRRQKRWWNAYILFYERLDIAEKKERTEPEMGPKIDMPTAIEQSVRRQNIEFLHNRTQFSSEYFQFMKRLAFANSIHFQNLPKPSLPRISQAEREELGLINLKLLCKFLFTVGLHTKKHIRGPANEWADVITGLVRQSSVMRKWFVCEVLLYCPGRIVEYLFDCPVGEIRSAFAKVIVFLANTTRQDGNWTPDPSRPLENWQTAGLNMQNVTLGDCLLKTVLELIHRDYPDTSRHLLQYFQLFVMYAGFGVAERKQLLDLGVLQTFIRLAIEDDRGTAAKYQLSELAKLYSLVSVLIRSCDVAKSMRSFVEGHAPKPNPFYDSIVQQPIMPIPEDVEGLIYTSNYVKKLLEESALSEETIHLLKFLSWECFSFSLIALSEVLFQISYSYSYELRPFLDILLHLLLMDDSWQQQRLNHAFRGVSDDREGLFDTIQRSKAHSQKRGYQCIKAIVQLLSSCEVAYRMIVSNDDLKHQWKSAVRWLGDELERRAPSAYSYNNWSPPTESNETSNGYFLERSHSARLTYAKACDFFNEDSEIQDGDTEQPEDTPPEEKTVFFPGPIDPIAQYMEMQLPIQESDPSHLMTEERSPADGQVQKESSD